MSAQNFVILWRGCCFGYTRAGLKLFAVGVSVTGGLHWCGRSDGGLHHLRGVDCCFPGQG
jgi:hypothetical protein